MQEGKKVLRFLHFQKHFVNFIFNVNTNYIQVPSSTLNSTRPYRNVYVCWFMRDHFLLPCKNIWFEKYIVWVTLLRSTFEVDGNGQESYTGQWTQQNTTSTWGRLFPSFGGVLMVKPRKWYEFEEILFPLRMFWWQRQWSQVAERDIFVPSRPSDVMIVKLTYLTLLIS